MERKETMEEALRSFSASFGEEAERTMPNHITVHNWPYGKPNTIFSVGEKPIITDNIFSATVKGVSYLGNIDDFNREFIVKSDEFEYEIPLGYSMLDIYERVAVYEDGDQIWLNERPFRLDDLSEDEIRERKLELFLATHKTHYAIFLPERAFDKKFCVFMGNLKYPEFFDVDSSDLNQVVDLAKKYSKVHKMPCLVAKCVYSCNWH